MEYASFEHRTLLGTKTLTTRSRAAQIGSGVRSWKVIGAHARPKEIIFTPDLPKTRSGKIMRRVLRGVAEGESDLSDMSTLADPSVVDTLQAQASK